MSTTTLEAPKEEPKKIVGVLQTRCQCMRKVDVPNPPPNRVQVELIPLPKEVGIEQGTVMRTFYLVQTGLLEGFERAAFYLEGPNPTSPRLVLPGQAPIDRRFIH